MLRTPVSPIFNFAPKPYCAADVILHCILGYCLPINNVASRVQKKKCRRIAYHEHRWLEIVYSNNAIYKWSTLKVDSDQETVVQVGRLGVLLLIRTPPFVAIKRASDFKFTKKYSE